MEVLFSESLALFNQDDPPEPDLFGCPVAFDCLPSAGGLGEEGADTPRELELTRTLERLLGSGVKFGVTALQVPAFVGHGAVLALETEDPLDAGRAEETLAKAPGVELWQSGAEGPTTRAAAGRDAVLVGRLRRDPSAANALLLWLAADLLRLAAANAVDLAVARLRRH
jgi:aspartate-semialdehyde dehydrogenase